MLRSLVVVLALAGCSKADPDAPAAAPAHKPTAEATRPAPIAQAQPARPRPTLAVPEDSDANPPGVPRLTGPIETDRGVSYIDEQVGTGRAPEKGKTVKVHYTGWLTDGTKFDSSRDREDAIQIRFDSGQVIKGWDIGLESMRAGGKRRLIIPAELAYGDHAPGDVIPPGSTLVFDVELLEVGD